MLHLIPAPLHRLLYRIADRARRQWWRFRKPRHESVFVVAFDGEARALLVRHSYGPPIWTLPGGGIARHEEPAAAIAREFREELKCGLSDLRLIATIEPGEAGSLNRRYVFSAQIAGTPTPDFREVVEVGVFPPDAVPANAGRWAARMVQQAANFRSAEAS